MAADETRTTSQRAQDQLREFRRIVSAAVGEIRSQEVRDTFASLSLEELADQHISRLEEGDEQLNPSRLQRITAVRDDLANSIEAMKATDPNRFRRADPENDVNTEPESDEDVTSATS